MDPWWEAEPWGGLGQTVGDATRRALGATGVPPLFDGHAATRREGMRGWAAHLDGVLARMTRNDVGAEWHLAVQAAKRAAPPYDTRGPAAPAAGAKEEL
jgi:hypothetical protein